MAQTRVGIQQGTADAHVAVPQAQVVHRPVNPLPLVPPLILSIEGHLYGSNGLHQAGAPQSNAPDRALPVIVAAEQFQANLS